MGSASREGLFPGGMPGRGGVPGPDGWVVGDPPVTATAAGGTHSTGIHSCSSMNFLVKCDFFLFCFFLSFLLKLMAV